MRPFDSSGVFRINAGEQELRRTAVRGAAASISAAGLSLGAQVISTFVLARLLTPQDFGVVAMVTTLSLLLINFGLNGLTEALIQAEEIDRFTASNLFWLNSLSGLILAIGFAGAGSLLAQLYQNPLVQRVAVALSFGIVISASSVIHLALLKRGMHFGVTSTNDVIGRVLNTVVSILMAFKGWGYWALVAGIVAQQSSVTVGAWCLCPWFPTLPSRTGRTWVMVRFGVQVYGRSCVRYGIENLDNLLIGWKFNAVALGFYKKAYDLFTLSGSQLISPINNVALATLSRLVDDPPRFQRYLSQLLGLIAFGAMAMSGDLTLVGRNVVRLVLGPKWSESGRVFELFGPGIGVMLLCSTVGWIHLAVGRPVRWLRWTLVELSVTAILFVLALPKGPSGVAAAWTVSYWILLIPGFWYAGRPIQISIATFVSAIWKYAGAGLMAGLATFAIVRGTSLSQVAPTASSALTAIVAVSALFMALYLGGIVGLHRGLAPLHQIASLGREFGPKRRDPKPTSESAVGFE